MMKRERIAVVVEDVEAARGALRWALHNILRYGDLLTLLHVVHSSATAPGRTKTKRTLRREGFKLALSFRDLCRAFPYIDVEIVVTDGDDEARRIAAVVGEIGASTLVLGLHDRSFLYKLIGGKSRALLGCKVVAVKEAKQSSTSAGAVSVSDMDFWEIHQSSSLSFPPPRKVPYRICPDPSAIIWRTSWRRRTI